jgi:hypothetical protein
VTDELQKSIENNAAGPAEVSTESQRVRQHSLQGQIEADRYLESKRAARKSGLPVRTSKLIPPGAA